MNSHIDNNSPSIQFLNKDMTSKRQDSNIQTTTTDNFNQISLSTNNSRRPIIINNHLGLNNFNQRLITKQTTKISTARTTKSRIFYNVIAEKLKKAKRGLSKYSVKRKSIFSRIGEKTNEYAWINCINDEYSNKKYIHSKIKSNNFHYYSYYIKRFKQTIVYLIIASLILSITFNEIYMTQTNSFLNSINPDNQKDSNFYYKGDFFSLKYFLMIDKRKITITENILRSINIVISIIIVILIWIKIEFELKLHFSEKKITEYDNIFSLGIFPRNCLMSLFALICIPPHTNCVFHFRTGNIYFVYSLSACFLLLSYLKLYILYDNLSDDYCKYNTKISRAVCNNNHNKPGIHFTIKCIFKSKPIPSIIGFMLIALIILTSIIRSFEIGSFNDKTILGKKGINDLRNKINCIWIIVMTFLSNGYGDVSPRSPIGRLVIVVSSLCGSLLIAYIIIVFSTFSEFNNEERKAYYKLKKLFHKDNDLNKAATVIKYILYLRRYYKEEKSKNTTERYAITLMLYSKIKMFKNKNHLSSSYSMPVTDLLLWIGKNMQNNWNDLNENIIKIGNLEEDLISIIQSAKDSKRRIKNISIMQNNINSFLLNRMNELFKEMQIKNERSHHSSKLPSIKLENNSIVSFGCKKKISYLNRKYNEGIKYSDLVNEPIINTLSINYLPKDKQKKKFNSGQLKQIKIKNKVFSDFKK